MSKIDRRLRDARGIELDNAFYVEDGTRIESLTIASNTPFDMESLLADISSMTVFYDKEIPTTLTGVQIRRVTTLANESYPSILGLVLRQETIPSRIVLQDGVFEVVVTAQDWGHFRELADEIQKTLGEFELRSVTQDETPGGPLDSGRLKEVLISKLAGDQLAILETAFNHGYFHIPRETSETEFAEELGIAQSTLSERFRTAERNLLELIYGPRQEQFSPYWRILSRLGDRVYKERQISGRIGNSTMEDTPQQAVAMSERSRDSSSVERGTGLTRRDYVAATAIALSATGLTGYTGDGGGGNGGTDGGSSLAPDAPSGTPETVETKYWREWETIDVDEPSLGYSATTGAVLDPVPLEFSSEDDPWMREHALMVQHELDALGVKTQLNDRPLNRLYAQSWDTKRFEAIIPMSTHDPDSQRGLDLNPLLMRRGETSLSNYDNYYHPGLQEVPTEQSQTTGRPEREELVAEAQRIFSENVGAPITLFPNIITAVNTERWSGYVQTPGSGLTRDSFVWSEANLQPQTDGRTYIRGVTTSINSLNLPQAAGGVETERLTFIYDGLFDATPDLEIVPALATGGGFVDDTTVKLTFREGVEQHDGEPFAAEDVKFTVELYKKHSSTSQTPFYEPVESVEVPGDHEVRFNLEGPDVAFMTQRVVRSVTIPKHKWEDAENPSQHNPKSPVGMGPFTYENRELGTRFEVPKNEGHWILDDDWWADVLGDQVTTGEGVDCVIWINVGNIDSTISSLQGDEIDAIGTTLSNSQAGRAASTAGVEKMTPGNFAPLDTKLMFSCPLVRDREFRATLAKSIDTEGFAADVLQDHATVPSGENPISDFTPWRTLDTTHYELDIDGTKSLLEQAGYTRNDDGNLRFPNGDAWAVLVERIQSGNIHRRRDELGQVDFL